MEAARGGDEEISRQEAAEEDMKGAKDLKIQVRGLVLVKRGLPFSVASLSVKADRADYPGGEQVRRKTPPHASSDTKAGTPPPSIRATPLRLDQH